MDHLDLVKVFGAFFAIMNPFVNLPIFLSLTDQASAAEQRRLACQASLASALICGIILLFGHQLIGFFGISISDFRIAGSLVLGSIAWSMLHGHESSSHHGSDPEKQTMPEQNIAFYPMAFPMIVGPGTMATLIIYSSHANSITELGIIAAIVAAVLSILFLVLFFAAQLGQFLGDSLRVIMKRIMGMILLSISVDMGIAGIKAVFNL